jgi:hypothetical protein
VYAFFKKGELPGRKVARRWLTTRDMVLGWLKGPSEQDTLARALTNGDTQALTAALKSGKMQVKNRKWKTTTSGGGFSCLRGHFHECPYSAHIMKDT